MYLNVLSDHQLMWTGKTRYGENMNIAFFSSINFGLESVKQL